MSYTYLLEQGEEFLAESFSDIPASVLSKSSPTAAAFYSSANETESSHGSRSGMTCGHSMEIRGVEELISSPAVSHAQRSASLTTCPMSQESKENQAHFGEKWPEWFAKLDPLSSSWKIRQLLLFEDLEPSLRIWPRWGTMQRGACFPLSPAVDPMLENEFSSLLRTPMASDGYAWAKTNKNDVQTSIHKTLKRGGTYRNSYRFQWASLTPTQYAEYCETMMDWPMRWTESEPLEMAKFQQWLRMRGEPCPQTPF